MCAEFEILVRKANLNNNDIKFIENTFEKYKFGLDICHYSQMIENTKSEIDMDEEINEEFRKIYHELETDKDIITSRKKLKSFSDIEKNSVSINSDSYNGLCLCNLKDDEIIKNLLKDLLHHFEEVYYQPYCFNFYGEANLDFTTDYIVSISKDTEFDFQPSMSFRPMFRIVN